MAGCHLARLGAIWRSLAPFGAAGRHLARAGRSGAIWRGSAIGAASGAIWRGSRAGHLEASPGRKWEADLGRADNHCPRHFKVRRCGDSPCGDSSAIRPSRIIHCGSDCPYDLRVEWPEKGRRTRDRKRQVAQGFDRDRRPAGVPNRRDDCSCASRIRSFGARFV